MNRSLQELYSPEGICFGCGPRNAQGLRLKSFVQDDLVLAEWLPSAHHQAFPGMLNGGIAGALLDCHSNWTAAYHLMRANGWEEPQCTVTAEYAIKLLRPTPIDAPLRLSARVVDSSLRRANVEAEMSAGGEVCVSCRGVFVVVKEGHPAYHAW